MIDKACKAVSGNCYGFFCRHEIVLYALFLVLASHRQFKNMFIVYRCETLKIEPFIFVRNLDEK